MTGKVVLLVLVVIVFLMIVMKVTAQKAVSDFKKQSRRKKPLLNKNKKI